MAFTRAHLERFEARHDNLVGLDSDGCVFDTMEPKQKLCFHGLIAAHWGLAAIEPLVRQVAEFVNLHSCWRGQNRFTALLQTFDLLAAHPGLPAGSPPVPRLPALRVFAASGVALGEPALAAEAARTGSAELADVLAWSRAVNAEIARRLPHAQPFPGVQACLARLRLTSDVLCVSQTPGEALEREWRAAGLADSVAVIAGQELGSKAEHLALAMGARYAPGRVLMVGDALGDLRAARAVGACFYPIDPGHEAVSWERFRREAYDRFLAGSYAGAYETARVAAFTALLPETPPWARTGPL